MICVLTISILRFQRLLAKLHWQFDFFALGFDIVLLALYTVALSSTGPERWSLPNIILVSCFAIQIPIQLWAINVVSLLIVKQP